MITGQIVVREVGEKSGDGRALYMVMGIVAAPAETFKSEHQYDVAAVRTEGDEVQNLNIHRLSARDVSAETRGEAASGIFRKPIWRV